MRNLLRNLSRAAGVVAAAGAAVRIGVPMLAGVMFLALLVLGIACWVISSGDRSDRVTRMIYARRGDVRCLEPVHSGSVVPTVRRERGRQRRRRRSS